ncbi:hypothetical protein TraAM80_08450 [Trypanosoma rangeli]|uniref:Uncharacterized protein n=1 Tax=Trypanosoma rangeli TaxID=5698 RepID=A0A422N0P2_TRYRA|nr:uncharacterized protein TraAM80_08450 [Trypanosoma rangeli]RNE99009.1 hypothetical protein TraAM80_08450 [Trypanosoma rangeli]|eukprot:RNE99009.1 hypothetical protein TraAM80_08450 [Trypanosoma rangeli]
MTICPGLCGELAVTPFRVFLGTLPTLALEERFLRQLQPVHAWYSSRKRVKEQANEFIEIDLASCDLELLLRYSHVYYVRRQLFDEAIDKQLTLLDTGKAPKMAEPAMLQCLHACNTDIGERLHYEVMKLQASKKAACVPNRRELDPSLPLEIYDYTCMMRMVEEDMCGVEDAEMRARSYLPRSLVEAKVQHLTEKLLGSDAKGALEKREIKLLNRMVPPDYIKVGCVEKLRPCDVTAYFRFYGERISKASTENYFKRALWGHVYRKYATTPSFLRGISMYWARHSGLDTSAHATTMPQDLAVAVCKQQTLFSAIKFRSQYMYASPDLARQLWRRDVVIPLMRLFPLMGAQAAEDLAASVLVDAFWARLPISDEENLLNDSIVRLVRQFVDETSNIYEASTEAVLKRVEEGCRLAVPHLTAEEVQRMNPTQDEKVTNEAVA